MGFLQESAFGNNISLVASRAISCLLALTVFFVNLIAASNAKYFSGSVLTNQKNSPE